MFSFCNEESHSFEILHVSYYGPDVIKNIHGVSLWLREHTGPKKRTLASEGEILHFPYFHYEDPATARLRYIFKDVYKRGLWRIYMPLCYLQ